MAGFCQLDTDPGIPGELDPRLSPDPEHEPEEEPRIRPDLPPDGLLARLAQSA